MAAQQESAAVQTMLKRWHSGLQLHFVVLAPCSGAILIQQNRFVVFWEESYILCKLQKRAVKMRLRNSGVTIDVQKELHPRKVAVGLQKSSNLTPCSVKQKSVTPGTTCPRVVGEQMSVFPYDIIAHLLELIRQTSQKQNSHIF